MSYMSWKRDHFGKCNYWNTIKLFNCTHRQLHNNYHHILKSFNEDQSGNRKIRFKNYETIYFIFDIQIILRRNEIKIKQDI